jgi:lipoyl(octanoyl) transferase
MKVEAAGTIPAERGETWATIEVTRLGLVPYSRGLDLQAELVRQRREGTIPDTLLLLQHPHVITLGSSTHPENVLADEVERERLGIELFKAGRGGDVTYHGPGQLVGYPILDLKPDRTDLHAYLRDLEGVLITVLSDYGLTGCRREGLTGVWVGDRKLAAIGVRVSSGWISSHGFALNVSTDLGYFGAIIPCGIQEYGVGSLESELGRAVSMQEAQDRVEHHFRREFQRNGGD